MDWVSALSSDAEGGPAAMTTAVFIEVALEDAKLSKLPGKLTLKLC